MAIKPHGQGGMRRRERRRAPLVIGSVAVLHFAVSLGLLAVALGASMSRFDRGEAPSFGEAVVRAAIEVLHFPLVWALDAFAPGTWFAGLSGYLPFAVNSLLWGSAGYAGFRLIQRDGT